MKRELKGDTVAAAHVVMLAVTRHIPMKRELKDAHYPHALCVLYMSQGISR